MKGIYEFDPQVSQLRLVNLGCGRTVHPAWVNLDLVPAVPGVVRHNLTFGLPFRNDEVDAIYHSHVLEHLRPEQGTKLLQECFRALRPGGVLRIVVPDLEQIAQLYLNYHTRAWQGDSDAQRRYQWIKLELLDQLVRSHSGGQMGPYLVKLESEDAEFVRSRLGEEVLEALSYADRRREPAPHVSLKQRVKSVRERLALWLVTRILGRNAAGAFAESLFRNRGEVHRWMYDRFSLKTLCSQIGFVDFEVKNAASSGIPGFDAFQLDRQGESTRKPDSLFCECRKPLLAQPALSPSAAA
jgi:predicted SAM-dependent methyltransferase